MEEEKHSQPGRKKGQGKKNRAGKNEGPKFFLKKPKGTHRSQEEGFTGPPEGWFDGK